MPENKNFSIVRRDSWERKVYFETDDCSPIDITGWTIFFTVKEKMTDTDTNAKIKKTITTHTNPLNGESEIILSPTETNLSGSYVYDVQVKTSADSVLTLMNGTISFIEDVTQRTS